MEWYRGVRTRPVGDSFRYAAALFALFAALTIAVMAPGMVSLVGDIRAWTQSNLPDWAEFGVDHGQFYTSLAMPAEFKTDGGRMVIDTTIAGMEFPPASADTIVVVGRDAVFIRDGVNNQQAVSFKDTPGFRTDKTAFLGLIDRWGPWLALLILLLAGLGTFLALVAAEGVFVLLTSGVIALFLRFGRTKLTFRQLLATGLHALTLPLVVDFVTGLFGLTLPFAFPFIYLMFFAAVLADERARPVEANRV